METSIDVIKPGFRLGKLAPKIDPRTFKLSKYIKALPPPPTTAGYIDKVSNWPMMLNDTLGDCTCACAGHMIEQWSTFAGAPFTPTDPEILTAYEAVSGYVPGNPNTDNGAVILDVLKYWKKTGIGSHKIVAYVSVNPQNPTEVQQAIKLFGNCYIGVGLPLSAQTTAQGGNGLPLWSVPSGGLTGNGAVGSWGGHAIPLVGYSTLTGKAGYELISWGAVYDATQNFISAYCDEAWAVLSQDWIESNGVAVSGFDLAALQTDLSQL